MSFFGANKRSTGLDLEAGAVLGRVERIDSNRVEIAADPTVVGRATVTDLLAMPARGGYLIGMIESVSRNGAAGSGNPALRNESISVTAMPIGTIALREDGSPTFRTGASVHPHVGGGCHLLEGPMLTQFMGLLGEDIDEQQRLRLGTFVADRDSVAIADGNRLLQRHVSILGNTGAGKSWTVALLLERAAALGNANIVVLDVHGEYAPLTEPGPGGKAIAQGLRIAGPADLLATPDEVLHLPFWLLQLDELLSLVMNEDDQHAPDQRLCVTDHVQTLKRSSLVEMGRHSSVSTATSDSPVPYKLDDLLRWLKADEVEKIIRHPTGNVDPGPFAGKLGGMIARLESKIADPRYGFVFHPPQHTDDYDWLVETATKLLRAGGAEPGIKVIDLSEVPSPILPMVAGVLARLIYNVQFWMDLEQRTPVCIVCDEAHVYLPARPDPSAVQRVALEAFEAIAKEGRKYGVCVAVVSQRPSDVSRTILSQCNNFVILRLTNDHDQAVIESLLPGSMSGMTGVLPMLDVGEAIMIGDAVLLPVRIKLDAPIAKPASVTLPYWQMWSTKPSSDEAIADGVAALRNQWRGELPEALDVADAGSI